ncbi:hypothetical protein [Cellulomonas fimi]|uniref:Uncharacterized protein n=1 Tax=Cellulomonas fimi (strain ATCC 484 / DSM 20113 / JCM 1341 / CCUG 24087 / LMG 16345 / NBRC 15513 / NCIMB 8980 / NCTC 7547 / NRS-133) TaxID=590998 RepID=F4H2Q7_CELFA|nr:hypothetical protein [Cellulomonas fimi]AEE46406.1 hypothetical protein Celf_2279 [Cellulomonas fimi ATCC 484]NNH08697.1 hypothetical protein [Cellulomonas fimi]VEH32867.1 Uncharacterised protein [Cellulomonas fimi]
MRTYRPGRATWTGDGARGDRDPRPDSTARPVAAGLDRVVGLQRLAGNRVVRQLLGARTRPVVQRKEYGLDEQPRQDRYVDTAVRLWRTQRSMPIGDFVAAVMTAVQAELTAAGVPLFGWVPVTGAGAAGVFDSAAWKVKVNVAKFTSRLVPKTLGDLTPAEVTEVVGTLFHESRHADQDVLVIRSLLDQKRTPQQIHAATKIRKDVIQAVRATRSATPLDPDQVAHAGRMFDVMYGTHKELLTFLMAHSAAVEGIDRLSLPTSRPADAARHVATLTTWQTSVLRPKLRRMAAAKAPTPVETALQQRLAQVDSELTALSAAWRKVAGARRPGADDVDDLRQAAGDTHAAITDAYTHLESEADAFRVEGEVTTAFAARIATP